MRRFRSVLRLGWPLASRGRSLRAKCFLRRTRRKKRLDLIRGAAAPRTLRDYETIWRTPEEARFFGGSLSLPPVTVHGTLLIFFPVVRIAGIFHLRIIGRKVFSAQLADIFVISVTAEKALALIIQIIAPRHRISLRCQKVLYGSSLITKTILSASILWSILYFPPKIRLIASAIASF